MTTYYYVKAPPGHTLLRPPTWGTYLRRGLSALLLTLGVAAVTSAAYPLIVYELTYSRRFQLASLSSPDSKPSSSVAGTSDSTPTFLPEMINTSLDYTSSSVWFPQAKASAPSSVPDSTFYTLSIPRLGIEDALVKYGHRDLKESLVHYPETALPGDLGNAVVFGHSVLPQFFSPQNYVSIFSTLHTLKPGDIIQVTHDATTYTYRIYDMYEVTPDNLSPLAQTYDARRLTLITCTPPGTYLRRLIVKALLI